MANEMITQLPTVTGTALTDIIYAVQGFVSPSNPGTSVQETVQQVFNLFLANAILNNAGNPNGAVAGVTYQLCLDTTHSILYICTTSGSAGTAVWTALNGVVGLVTPANGGTGVANPTAHALPVAEGASNFTFLGPLSNGQLLIGSTGADPVAGAPANGTNISWTTGAGSLTANLTGTVSATLGGTGVASPAAHGIMVAEGSSAVNPIVLTNNQYLSGSTGADPVPTAFVAGTNIGISYGAGTTTISATGAAGLVWTTIAGTSQTMVSDNGYITNNAGLVTLTLPATSAVGDQLGVIGRGAGGWSIAQGAGQQVHVGSAASTSGAGGSVSSTNQFNSINLICTIANTTWTTWGAPQGNLTVV